MARKLGQNNIPSGGLAFGISPAFDVFAVWESFNLIRPQQIVPVIVFMPEKLQENWIKGNYFIRTQ